MTTLYEDELYPRLQREFAAAQAAAPRETVDGVTFCRTVHGTTRPEAWHVHDMGIDLSIVDAAHTHNGAHFAGWVIDRYPRKIYPARREAMRAAIPLVREMVQAHAQRLETQLRDAQERLARIEEAIR